MHIELIKRETSEDIRELKVQLDRERGITMGLNELTSQLKESNTRLEEINTNLEESYARLEESKPHHEFMERQTTAEIDKMMNELDKSNISLRDIRQGSNTETKELEDELTRCKDIIAGLKAAGPANIVQLECGAARCNCVPADYQTIIGCDIAGSRQSIDNDDAVENSKAASPHEKNQVSEEVRGLKEQMRRGKAASTIPTSVLQPKVQKSRMWRHIPVCRSQVHFLFKQRKVKQVETANPALLNKVLNLREQARAIDRRLACLVVGLSLLSCRCSKVADKY